MDANGKFAITTAAYPGETFMIYLPNGVNTQSMQTDALGDGSASVAIQPALVEGRVWFDYNADRTYDATGPDKPLANLPLLVRTANGTVYTSVTTDADGFFSYAPTLSLASMMVSQPLYVVDPTNNKLYGTVNTDMFGSGRSEMPLPPLPPIITGYLVFDMNKSNFRDFGDIPYPAGTALALLFANGTTYLTTTVSSSGNFTFEAGALVVRSTTLSLVVTANATAPIGLITTNPYGEANQNILLPPPVLTGVVFYDMNRDSAFEAPPDVPAADDGFQIKFANGSIFSNISLDADGVFRVDLPVPMPMDSFSVIRASQPSVAIASLKTDPSGSGSVAVPLPPGVISGVVFTDYIRNNQKDPTEPYYANIYLHIYDKDGVDIPGSPLTTNSTGGFEIVTFPQPNMELRLVQWNGDVIKTFMTDAQGSLVAIAPIPPPTTTTLTSTTETTSSTSETTTYTETSTSETVGVERGGFGACWEVLTMPDANLAIPVHLDHAIDIHDLGNHHNFGNNIVYSHNYLRNNVGDSNDDHGNCGSLPSIPIILFAAP